MNRYAFGYDGELPAQTGRTAVAFECPGKSVQKKRLPQGRFRNERKMTV